MNSCLSCWWELICLAILAIFQMHSSKGYSKPKIVQLQIPFGSSQTYAVPACCYQSLIQSPRAAANSKICCPEHHCDVEVGVCQRAHTRNLLFFKCTKSHISIKRERTFLMLPFSHGSRISLNQHFLQNSVTVSTALSSE